jgi:hypothetical protein
MLDTRSRIRGLGQVVVKENGMTDLGLSILSIGMVTSVAASIQPSLFTFAAFSRKPEEQSIARKTLFIALGATTITSAGIYIVFRRLAPAIVSQVMAFALFGMGMVAAHYNSGPETPTMEYKPAVPAETGKKMSGLIQPRLAGLRNGVMIVR